MDEDKILNGSEDWIDPDPSNFNEQVNRDSMNTASDSAGNAPNTNYANAEGMSGAEAAHTNGPDNIRHEPFTSQSYGSYSQTPNNNSANPYWQNQGSSNPYWQNQNSYEQQRSGSGEGGNGYFYGQNGNQTQEQTNYQTYDNWQTEDTEDEKERKKCKKDRCKIAAIPAICAVAGFVLGFLLTYNFLTTVTAKKEVPVQTEKEIETTVVYRDNNDLSDIVESTMDSIVTISSTVTYEQYNFFTGYQQYNAASGGSGIIVGKDDTNLYIVTNNHVIEDAEDITVKFNDDTSFTAEVNGTSKDPDVAILTVKLSELTPETLNKIKIAKLHTENDLKIGNQVIAIGNALGYGQSVTVGYISALNRTIKTTEGTANGLIQTDAAINPGNSGGALLNMNGEVIGINVAKYSSTSVEGIGYSIPVSEIQDLIGMLSKEKISEDKRGYLGIQCTTVDQSMASLYDMPQGVYVYKILNEDIRKDGLMDHDIITSVDGHLVTTSSNLTDYLAYYKAGEQIKIVVERLVDGKFEEKELTVTLVNGASL